MVLLSSLLGPAKPPVASQEDVTSSGGLFRVVEYAGSLVAEAVESGETVNIPEGDRCLICLSDYEAAEELRQLNKCEHLFHRDCIDQVRCRPTFFPLIVNIVMWLMLVKVVNNRSKLLSPLSRRGCS